MAEQLDVRLVLEATYGVRNVGRVYDLLSEHGVRTVEQFSVLTSDRLLEWGIDDYYVRNYARPDAQTLTQELATSPQSLSTVKQQLLVRNIHRIHRRRNINLSGGGTPPNPSQF